MSSFLTELFAAVTQLRRSPGFTTLAVLLLAVGIGVNVAIFSIFQSIVLSPLPYAAPERLVGLSAFNAAKALTMPALSASDFKDFHERATSYKALAAYRPNFSSYVPAGGASPVQLVTAMTTEDFFPLFGVPAMRGRFFTAEEFSSAGPRSAILSFRAWRRQFGERDDILGETILLDDVPTTVVGIMPEDFREPEFVDVWVPFPQESPEYMARDSRFWTTVGRLKDGTTLAAAQIEATTIATGLAQEYSSTNKGWTAQIQPLLEQRVGGLRHSLLLLVGGVGLVLVIACVNLANLMLARGVSRFSELAIRLALGATPRTLARGVFLESVLLALCGGLLGVVFAVAGLAALVNRLPPGLIPRATSISVHGPTLAFAVGVSLLTGVVFGLLPAWQVLRANVNDLLKTSGDRAGTSRFSARAQSGLIVGQVALTLMVLSGATLLVQSLLNLQRTNPGFTVTDVLAVRIALPQSRWSNFQQLSDNYDRLAEEVRHVPGVEAVAFDSSAPLCGITLRYPFWVQGRPREEGNSDDAVFAVVTPDFLKTLRIPLLSGRFITEQDNAKGRPVCVINRALAERLFPHENPIGKKLQTVPWLLRSYREIVGVVGDTKQENLADLPPAQIYVPQPQSPWFFSTLLVRIHGGAAQANSVQLALRRVDPTLTMTIRSLEENMDRTSAQPRLRTLLFSVFAVLALGLSAFGIYASMAFTVSQRIREIGVRMALGASPLMVLGWVLGRGARMCFAGVVLGLVGAVGLGQLLGSLLYGVTPTEPLMLAGLAVFLPFVALVASAVPAIAAARLNPTQALQQT